ncbi:MAG: transposase [Bacteroidota bacterium]
MKKHTPFKTPRLKGFDYSTPGCYFITICTLNRQHFLGIIEDSKMSLSAIGVIVKEELELTEKIRSNIEIDTYVIMPDHVHILIWITDGKGKLMPHFQTLPQTPSYQASFGMPTNKLGATINKFKGAVTRRSRQAGYESFGWQKKYHDRIVRNEWEYQHIKNYILTNPERWKK